MRRITAAIVGLAFGLGTLVSLTASEAQTVTDAERLQAVSDCLERSTSAKRKVRCVRRAMDGWAAPSSSPILSPSPEPSPEPSPSPSPTPSPTTGDTSGKQLRFSILCPPVEDSDGSVRKERFDPLVAPGRLSAHFHTFFGAQNVTVDRDVELTRAMGTTCRFSGDTGAYWIPVLYRNGEPVDPVQVLVYYRHNGDGPVVPHPQDHGIIADQHQWMCVDSDSFANPPDCRNRRNNPNGAGLRIIFRSENVSGGSTPRVAFNIRYGLQNLTGADFGRDVAGNTVTAHGDFWNTWVQDAYAALVNRCLNPDGVWRSYTTAEWEARCSKVTDADFAIGD